MHAHETSYSLCINILVNKINQIFVFTANRGQGHINFKWYRNKKSKRESGLFTQFPLQNHLCIQILQIPTSTNNNSPVQKINTSTVPILCINKHIHTYTKTKPKIQLKTVNSIITYNNNLSKMQLKTPKTGSIYTNQRIYNLKTKGQTKKEPSNLDSRV